MFGPQASGWQPDLSSNKRNEKLKRFLEKEAVRYKDSLFSEVYQTQFENSTQFFICKGNKSGLICLI